MGLFSKKVSAEEFGTLLCILYAQRSEVAINQIIAAYTDFQLTPPRICENVPGVSLAELRKLLLAFTSSAGEVTFASLNEKKLPSLRRGFLNSVSKLATNFGVDYNTEAFHNQIASLISNNDHFHQTGDLVDLNGNFSDSVSFQLAKASLEFTVGDTPLFKKAQNGEMESYALKYSVELSLGYNEAASKYKSIKLI